MGEPSETEDGAYIIGKVGLSVVCLVGNTAAAAILLLLEDSKAIEQAGAFILLYEGN